MKISCQSCQSKYTIADDKVAGKVVKIRCKKCGATIVVNGSGDAAALADAVSYAPGPHAGGADASADAWTVNVADGDQRTMTEQDIVEAFQANVVTEETFCWRDGMDDWLPLAEISQLSEAVGAARAAMAAPAGMAAASNGSGAAQAAAQAARRAGGRAGGGDLFGGAAQAGGEDEVMTSAPVGMPERHPGPPPDASKMTGERNENSVLFSLSALTSKGTGPTKPTTPGAEASGLIDIRQLSAQLHSTDDKKKSRIDDIMNLAGGGAFSPSLSGPILAAPSVSEYASPEETAAPAAGQSRGRGVVIAAAGAGLLVIVGAIGAAVMLMRKGETADKDKAAASASAAEVASGGPASGSAGSAAASAPPSATDTPAASASAAPAAQPTAEAPKVAANTAKAAAAAKDSPAPAAAAPAPAKDNSLAAAMAGAATPAPAAAAPAAAAGGSEPFNMGEAKARLAAAASAAQGCAKPGGPTGSGRIVVMFAPSGAAQSATISGPPYEGTPTGACVAARFKAVHVPAFSGSPFSVSKSFSIN
jgi:predicted Zn finger-like uncharacterized protein